MVGFILPNFDMSKVDIYILIHDPDFLSSQRRQTGISRAQVITPILKYPVLPVRSEWDGMMVLYIDIYTIGIQRLVKYSLTLETSFNPKIRSYNFQNSAIHDGKLVSIATNFV